MNVSRKVFEMSFTKKNVKNRAKIKQTGKSLYAAPYKEETMWERSNELPGV
jgi:hypothetical protein